MTQAYLKAGLMGFAGAGKTYTASLIAVGLMTYLRERKIEHGDRPVYFLDTETGSDFVQPLFARSDIELRVAKTRAFADLVPAIDEAAKGGAILIIDSITHFWREFTDAYAKRNDRTRGLEFRDWAYLKHEWGKFTDAYVNSSLHIIMCGRAGYEYDFFLRDDGKRELEKTGVKMRAETETGYEPSLLVLMEREMDMESKRVYRVARVLKDRFGVIDGAEIRNPTFASFAPHIERLNLGGVQLGIDTSRSSEEMIPESGKPEWQWRAQQKEILLEKTKNLFIKHDLDGTSSAAKKQRLAILKEAFGSDAWSEIEAFPYDKVRAGFDALHLRLEGAPYFAVPLPAAEEQPGAEIAA